MNPLFVAAASRWKRARRPKARSSHVPMWRLLTDEARHVAAAVASRLRRRDSR